MWASKPADDKPWYCVTDELSESPGNAEELRSFGSERLFGRHIKFDVKDDRQAMAERAPQPRRILIEHNKNLPG